MLVHLLLTKKKFNKSIKVSSLEVILVLIGILYAFIVFYLSMYKEFRYILAVTPFIFVIIPIFLNQIDNKYLLYITLIIVVLSYTYKAIYPLPRQQSANNMFYVNNKHINIIVYDSIFEGFAAIDRSFLLPEYPDQQKYFFTTNYDLLKQTIQENRHGYLISSKYNNNNLNDMGITPGYAVRYSKFYWWNIYEYNLDATELSVLEQQFPERGQPY